MAAIYRKMYGNRFALACFIIITVSLLAAYAAFAQGRTMTLKCTSIIHHIQREIVEAGDTPGHSLRVGENQGLAIFENGELATQKNSWLWDETESNGKSQGFGYGYGVYTFEDGSTMVWKFKGAGKDTQKAGKFLYEEEGTLTITGGTGRFKGIKGTGTYTGKSIAPESELYVEFTLNYTLP